MRQGVRVVVTQRHAAPMAPPSSNGGGSGKVRPGSPPSEGVVSSGEVRQKRPTGKRQQKKTVEVCVCKRLQL